MVNTLKDFIIRPRNTPMPGIGDVCGKRILHLALNFAVRFCALAVFWQRGRQVGAGGL